jgi:hypothetical protein
MDYTYMIFLVQYLMQRVFSLDTREKSLIRSECVPDLKMQFNRDTPARLT